MTPETFLTFFCLLSIGLIVSVTLGENEAVTVDLDLVKRSKKGDRAAFNELMRLYQKRVFNIMYRFCGNSDDAKDLTQDVFVKVFRSLPTLKEDHKFKSWIITIASNTFKNRYHYLKRRGSGRTTSIDSPIRTEEGEISIELPSSAPISDELLHKQHIERIVQDKITLLKNDFKEVIVLREIDGLSYEEISEILKISIGTVKSRIFRAREELKTLLSSVIDKL